MIRSLHTVKRNMNILQKKQENTSANIANVNTIGYKFQNILTSTLDSKVMVNHAGGANSDRRQELGNFVFGNQIDLVYKNFEQGILMETGVPTDYSIVGSGFFTIEGEDGSINYSRNGNFKVNDENQLVTMEGNPVIGRDENGNQSYIYRELGNTELDGKGPIFSENIEFLISDFADYTNLIPTGDTTFISTGNPTNIFTGEVRNGFLEMSNVSMVDEMVSMIEISREFEANQKLLHSANETLNKAVNEIGRV